MTEIDVTHASSRACYVTAKVKYGVERGDEL